MSRSQRSKAIKAGIARAKARQLKEFNDNLNSGNDVVMLKQEDTTIAYDNVNHPPHYTFSKYEVFDVLQAWFPYAPVLWQAVKYIARAAHKGDYAEDLMKARWYLDKAIAETKGDLKNGKTS